MKKWFLRIVLGIFLAFVLLYVFVLVRSLIPVTVHDEELRLARASIPQGSNAFDVLQEAGSHVWWPTNQDCEISDLAKNTNWDAALAGTVLASNRVALAGWDTAVKMPDLQVPEVYNIEDLQPYLPVWKKLAHLASIRENVLLRSRQDKEAFDQMVGQIQLGRRMQNARGTLIVYLVGVAVNNMGLNQMQHWVGKTHLTPNQLKDYIRQLEIQPGEEATAFANTIKVEYQFQIVMLDATCNGKMTNSVEGGYYPRVSSWRSAFNFSQTKALCAKGALMLVKSAPHHYSEANMAYMESRPSLVSMYLSGNAVGQILHYMAMPAMARSLAKKSQADVSLQATRTILAMRAYQLTHGNLPKDLSALVPEFLDAVPVDDFDGQPLRYSVERKIVYSVGKNLKDDGGDDRVSKTEPSHSHLDIVFKFEF